MTKSSRTPGEQEIGVRAARECLPTLLSTVEQGGHVIHLTRRGKRIAALVSADLAEPTPTSPRHKCLAMPGDLAGMIKTVELLLTDDDAPGPNLKTIDSNPDELTSAAITLIDILARSHAVGLGLLHVTSDDGTVVSKPVADILVRKLFNRPDTGRMTPSPLPVIAGCLWSTQVGGSAVKYRALTSAAVTIEERLAWVIALWELCMLINCIHEDGVAESLMYEIEEYFREGKNRTGPECGGPGQ